MKIGCCISLFDDRILSLGETGADYAEVGLSQLAEHSREEIRARADQLQAAGVSCQAANLLFPGGLRLTGTDADHGAAARYLDDALDKAALLNISTLVFGSGGARAVPEGFSRERAWEQLVDLCRRVIAPAFSRRGMVCCIEPLNRKECNILNTCAESAQLVRDVGEDSVRLLCDLYHFDLEQEPRASLADYRGILAHAHIASAKNSRALPRPGDGEDYASFFRMLREIDYPGLLSLEGSVSGEFTAAVREAAAYLKSFAS